MNEEEKVAEILSCLQHFGTLGEAVFVRAGRGLFEDLGFLKPWLVALVKSLAELPRVRLVLLSTRQPSVAQLPELPNIFWFHVPPLEDEAVATLLRMELAQEGITDFDPNQEVLLTIGGHPGVARSFVGQVVQQGAYLIDKLRAGLFRVQDTLLSKNLNYDDLTELQRHLLCLMSWVPYLDGRLLEMTLHRFDGSGQEHVVPCLHDLVMVCLVDVGSHTYTISRPVRLLFRRKHGFGEDELLTAFARALTEYWGEAERQGTIRGSLIDTMIFMYVLEGKSLPEQFRRLLLPGTLLEVVRELYNEAMSLQAEPEGFDKIIALAPVAEEIPMEDSTREAILGLLVRACVRTRRYAEAERWLQTFDRRGYRSVYSLRGFLHRLRGEYAAAIPWYEKALEARIHDLAILHELCICLHRLGRIAEIKDKLRRAGDRTLDNVYLLDMRIQIATGEGQFREAEELIHILRRKPDEGERSYRREAVLVMRRDGDFVRAVSILDRSIERLGGVAVEHRSSRAIANAYLGQFTDAKRDVDTIRRSRHSRAEEIALRLETHLALASGDWKTALNPSSTPRFE